MSVTCGSLPGRGSWASGGLSRPRVGRAVRPGRHARLAPVAQLGGGVPEAHLEGWRARVGRRVAIGLDHIGGLALEASGAVVRAWDRAVVRLSRHVEPEVRE